MYVECVVLVTKLDLAEGSGDGACGKCTALMGINLARNDRESIEYSFFVGI